MQEGRSPREPRLPEPWKVLLGAGFTVGLGLWAGCIADSGVDLCAGDDPLPECVDGALPNGALDPTGQTISTGGDPAGGDSGPAGSDNGCNPQGLPTWDSPVKTIMQNHCVRCHRSQTSTYTGITPWVQNGLLEQYTNQGHYISGTDKTNVLSWINNGAPEHACDVP